MSEVKSEADFLVSLDKKHFLNAKVAKFLKPQKALTPKMLIETMERRQKSGLQPTK